MRGGGGWTAGAVRAISRNRVARAARRRLLFALGIDGIRQQLRYTALRQLVDPPPHSGADLTPFELSVFSQNGEDGVIAEIVRRLGSCRTHFVEIGAHGGEANCLALADVFGWSGLFVDADPAETSALESRYAGRADVRVACRMVTRENIASILEEAAVPHDLGLLSLDVDGNDYWLWEALTGFAPSVVVTEFNATLGAERAVVQPYDAAHVWDGTSAFGASIAALRALARRRGYRLVHVDLTGTNAFFVRDGAAPAGAFLDDAAVALRPQNLFLSGAQHPPSRRPAAWVEVT